MRLALGTVQFGTEYGVANTEGQVKLNEVKQILEYAKSVGIDTLDTAAAYGESESLLGRIGVKGWNLVTKVPSLPPSVDDVGAWISEQVYLSLDRLQAQTLDGLLLHRPEDILGGYGVEYLKELNRLQDLGLVKLIGYSIYSPEVLKQLCEKKMPEIVQAPFNVFDQRIRTSGWLDRLVDNGVQVHARSVFLQGLLLLPPDKIPKFFKKWHKLFAFWHKVIEDEGVSAVDIALNFVYQEDRFDRIVVGIDGAWQLKQMVESIKIEVPLLPSVQDRLSSVDIDLIEPSRWKL